jgi:predicted ATP-dependent protease
VIIPRSNIQNLVLSQEVQEAVRDGVFHIYPVTTVDEGMFLLSGQEMGKMDQQGQYPEGGLGRLIVKKLERMREAAHPKED